MKKIIFIIQFFIINISNLFAFEIDNTKSLFHYQLNEYCRYNEVYVVPPEIPKDFRIKHLTKNIRLQVNLSSLYSTNKMIISGEQQKGELLSTFLNTFNIYFISDY